MDRLQKKCFVASTGLHLLLGVILLVGPAFVGSRSKQDNMPVLDFVPLKTVDALMSGGGDPTAKAQAPELVKPQPLPSAPPAAPKPPPPVEVKQPDPPKETIKEPSPPREPEYSFEPAKKEKAKKPTFEFTQVTRTEADAKAEARKRAETEAKQAEQDYQRKYAEWRRSVNSAFGTAVGSLEKGRSGSTDIKLYGPGGGGVPYANFYQAVKSAYDRAWILPDGITDDNAIVATSIVIARDGTVVSAHITRSSGNAAVDRSVQVTLDRVKWAAPLPDSETANQRTVEIKFNVAAKRALG